MSLEDFSKPCNSCPHHDPHGQSLSKEMLVLRVDAYGLCAGGPLSLGINWDRGHRWACGKTDQERGPLIRQELFLLFPSKETTKTRLLLTASGTSLLH